MRVFLIAFLGGAYAPPKPIQWKIEQWHHLAMMLTQDGLNMFSDIHLKQIYPLVLPNLAVAGSPFMGFSPLFLWPCSSWLFWHNQWVDLPSWSVDQWRSSIFLGPRCLEKRCQASAESPRSRPARSASPFKASTAFWVWHLMELGNSWGNPKSWGIIEFGTTFMGNRNFF